jgi:hypothetical protein
MIITGTPHEQLPPRSNSLLASSLFLQYSPFTLRIPISLILSPKKDHDPVFNTGYYVAGRAKRLIVFKPLFRRYKRVEPIIIKLVFKRITSDIVPSFLMFPSRTSTVRRKTYIHGCWWKFGVVLQSRANCFVKWGKLKIVTTPIISNPP